MYAGKRCNSKSNLTKRYKLDRVAPVDNRPPRIRIGARNRCEDYASQLLAPEEGYKGQFIAPLEGYAGQLIAPAEEYAS